MPGTSGLHLHDLENAWEKVLWSDETKIKIFGINSTLHVWRKRNAAYDPKNINPDVKNVGGKVQDSNAVTQSHCINGRIDEAAYCEILSDKPPSLRQDAENGKC